MKIMSLLSVLLLLISCSKDNTTEPPVVPPPPAPLLAAGTYKAGTTITSENPVMYSVNSTITDTSFIGAYMRRKTGENFFFQPGSILIPPSMESFLPTIKIVSADSAFITQFGYNNLIFAEPFNQSKKINVPGVDLTFMSVDTSHARFESRHEFCPYTDTMFKKLPSKFYIYVSVNSPSYIALPIFPLKHDAQGWYMPYMAYSYIAPGCYSNMRGIWNILSDNIKNIPVMQDTIVVQQSKIYLIPQ